MRSVVGRLGRGLRQTRAGTELSPSQYEVLATVSNRRRLRLSDLASIEGLNPTLLSRIVGRLEDAGLVMSGVSPELGLVEMIELPRSKHPYFIGCQFHPEFKSKPHAAHPLFSHFAAAALARRDGKQTEAGKTEGDGEERAGGPRAIN